MDIFLEDLGGGGGRSGGEFFPLLTRRDRELLLVGIHLFLAEEEAVVVTVTFDGEGISL